MYNLFIHVFLSNTHLEYQVSTVSKFK